MSFMNLNIDYDYENRYERQMDRLALRRRMLEKQAIEGGPDSFDYWADEIEKNHQEMKRLFVARLNHLHNTER